MKYFSKFTTKKMPIPTPVNSQITDAVTQVNVKVLGEAPAMAMGQLFQVTSQALSNAAHNATSAQQQTNVTQQAATTMGVAVLYGIDTATTGMATKQILELSNTKEHDALFLGNLKIDENDVQNLQKMTHLKYMHLSNVDIKHEHLQTLASALGSTEIYREQKVKV